MPLVLVQEDVGDGAAREGGEVPDGIYFGFQPLDIPEHFRPVLMAQLRPCRGHGVHVWRLPEEEFTLPRATDAPSSQTARTSDKDAGGQNLRRATYCGAESKHTVGASQLMD